MKKRIIRIVVSVLLVISLFVFCGCASCERSFKSCNADISGGLHRTVNVYSLDGKLLATYEGKIDIDDNTNGSVMFDLDGRRYVYYHAIVEVIEKQFESYQQTKGENKMITREQIEKIIEERYSDYPKFLSSTIEKIDTRFKWKATFCGERKIKYIICNPGPVVDRLSRDLANYYTALGFFGGIDVNEAGNIVVTLSIDPPAESVSTGSADAPLVPADTDARAEILKENK